MCVGSMVPAEQFDLSFLCVSYHKTHPDKSHPSSHSSPYSCYQAALRGKGVSVFVRVSEDVAVA